MDCLQRYIDKEKIVNNDIRYMHADVQAELVKRTPACSGDIGERLYWLRQGLTSYPACKACLNQLSSKSYINNVKGYRSYCSRKCMRNSDEYQIAYKQTCLERYGSEHSFSNTEVQARRQQTNLERYGDHNPGRWSSDLFKERMFDKYGEESALKIPDIRNQVSASLRKGYISSGKLDARLDEIYRLEQVKLDGQYISFDSMMSWRHDCGERFQSNLADGKIPSCPKCNAASKPEYELFKRIEALGVDVKRRDRTVIAPLELDIFIPSHNVAVELNGAYFHTELFLCDKAETYHLNKTKLCEQRGVRLLHVFDYEWREKPEIIMSKLMSLLNISSKLHARKLQLVTVTHAEAKAFLERHHLQGADKASLRYGLSNGVELLAVMTFCKARFSKNHEWELSRYASKGGITVVGGASRLLKAFRTAQPGASLITYADIRYSAGGLYHALGFTKLRSSPPNYQYVKSGERLSRYQAQKHKLGKLLGSSYDPLLTEVNNMNRNKWFRLFDCGNYVFELTA